MEVYSIPQSVASEKRSLEREKKNDKKEREKKKKKDTENPAAEKKPSRMLSSRSPGNRANRAKKSASSIYPIEP